MKYGGRGEGLHSPLQLVFEMDLVAVDYRLAVLVRRHHGRESTYLPNAVLDEDVPQVRQPHLLLLGRWMPPDRGAAIVIAARLFHQVKAGIQLLVSHVPRLQQAERILGTRLWVPPCWPAVTAARFTASASCNTSFISVRA